MIGDPSVIMSDEEENVNEVCERTSALTVDDYQADMQFESSPVVVESSLSSSDVVSSDVSSDVSSLNDDSLLSQSDVSSSNDDSLPSQSVTTYSNDNGADRRAFQMLEDIPIPLIYQRPPTNILVFGHSYVRRLHETLTTRFGPYHNLDLYFNYADVTMYGVGGMTTPLALSDHLQVVEELRPRIVFVQLGSNDLNINIPIRQIAANLLEICRRMVNLGVRRIVLGQVLPRVSGGRSFNRRVIRLNIEIAQAFYHVHLPCFLWRHRGVWHSRFNLMLPDGVHFNNLGNRRFFRSVRGAVLFAITSLRRFPHV